MSSSRIDGYDSDNDMPALERVSDSEESDTEFYHGDSGDEQVFVDASEVVDDLGDFLGGGSTFATFLGPRQNRRDEDEDMLNLEPIPPPTTTSSTASSVPTSLTTSAPFWRPRSNNRRARVESDDEGDVDRDRRHPFQRTGTGVGSDSSTGLSHAQSARTTQNHHTNTQRFFEAISTSSLNAEHAPNTRANITTPFPFPNTQSNVLHQDQSNQDHISISIDLGPIPLFLGHHGNGARGVHVHAIPNPNQVGTGVGVPGVGAGAAGGGHGRMPWMNMGPVPGNGTQGQNTADAAADVDRNAGHGHNLGFADFLTRMLGASGPGTGRPFTFGPGRFFTTTGGVGFGLEQLLNSLRGVPEREDPERARRLVDGLEDVPVGLVRRLERVAALDRNNGTETGAVGGDSGCAICWDRLLEPPGEGPEAPENNEVEEEEQTIQEETTSSSSSIQPEASTSSAETSFSLKKEKRKHPRIVSLPCAHVFHADCLIPWFTRPRQTTCPTCRFNIDPENLTATLPRRSQNTQQQPGNEQVGDVRRQRAETNGDENQHHGPGIRVPLVAPAVAVGGDGDGWGDLGLGAVGSNPERVTAGPGGLQWFPLSFGGPTGVGGTGGIGLLGVGMPMSMRPTDGTTGSGAPLTSGTAPMQPPSDSFHGGTGTPDGSSVSGPQDGNVSSTSSSSSAQADESARDTREGPSTPVNTTYSESATSSDASQGNANANPTANHTVPTDTTRRIAQAVLRMLGLQDMDANVNVQTVSIGTESQTGSATTPTPSTTTEQANSPAPNNITDTNSRQTPDSAGSSNTGNTTSGGTNTANTRNPNSTADFPHPPHGYWSFGVDVLIGTGPPPPGAVPLNMPTNPTGADNAHQNLEDDMMFDPDEDEVHEPIPHIHHFHHHHHTHDPEGGDGHIHEDSLREQMAAAQADIQRMMQAFTGIPIPHEHRQQPQAQPAVGNANSTAQPTRGSQPAGGGPRFEFGMHSYGMPGVHVTGNSLDEVFGAMFGGQQQARAQGQTQAPQSQGPTTTPAAPTASRNPSRSTLSQPTSGPTSTLADEINHLFGSAPPTTAVPIASRNPSRTTPSQPTSSRPTSTLPDEINHMFGSAPPIRTFVPQHLSQSSAVFPPWSPRSIRDAMPIEPISSSSSSPANQQGSSTAATPESGATAPVNSASTSLSQPSEANDTQPSGDQTEAAATEQRARQYTRRRPTTQLFGGEAADGGPVSLAQLLRTIAGVPPAAPNGAPRPTGLGAGGIHFGGGAGPSVETRRATRGTDGGNTRQERKWTPPPALGPTLRQRIETREREAGLRCWDTSCGVGPSDEDPFVEIDEAAGRQVRIRSTASTSQPDQSEEIRYVCEHTFHPSCLVSAQRVALRGADENVIGDTVEISCPVCRAIGVIPKAEWDEGARAL